MSQVAAVTALIAEIHTDMPEHAAHLDELKQFLMNGATVVDYHRFAALMLMASRIVAFIPGADVEFVDIVRNARSAALLDTPMRES